MASRRLTRALKDQIIENTQHAVLSTREEKLEEESYELIRSLRKYILGDWLQHYLDMPESFVSSEGYSVRVIVDGQFHLINIPQEPGAPRYCARPMLRVPNTAARLNGENPLGRAVLDYDERMEQLRADRRKLSVKLHALLDSVTTVKRLLEIWPEGESYIPKEEGPGQEMVSIVELNSLLVAARSRG